MLLPGNNPENTRPSRKFLGLFSRKERWGLSGRGWLAAVTLGLAAFFLLFTGIHPFLAVTDRVNADSLVMEGWVHLFAAKTAAAEFKSAGYNQILVTGEPVFGSGKYEKDSNTEAWVGADLLIRAGLPREVLIRIPRRQVDQNRTFGSALELKKWIREHHKPVHAVNIVTEDAHARRTRLLFQAALGTDIQVGVIAAPNPDYDPRHWWRYSEGVREVVGETIAYLYAKFLFWTAQEKVET